MAILDNLENTSNYKREIKITFKPNYQGKHY